LASPGASFPTPDGGNLRWKTTVTVDAVNSAYVFTQGAFRGQPGNKGQFRALPPDLKAQLDNVYQAFAYRQQDRVVELIQQKRSNRPRTGRMAKAAAKRGNGANSNVIIGADGFAVGIPRWLDSNTANAKYWRIIDQGSAAAAPDWLGPMVDREGVPLFGRWKPGPSRFKSYEALTGPGKLRPFSAEWRIKRMNEGWKAPRRSTPIQANEFYRQAGM
jgi:hypothetical protein